MSQDILERIRDFIRSGEFDLSMHASEEMAEDDLDILDVENAILYGQIASVERKRHSTKYVIEGYAVDKETPVGVVGRITENGRYLIITVYMISDREG